MYKQKGYVAPLSLRKPSFGKKTSLALAVPAIMSTGAVWAQDEVIELDTLQIEERTVDTNPYAEKGAPYKETAFASWMHPWGHSLGGNVYSLDCCFASFGFG